MKHKSFFRYLDQYIYDECEYNKELGTYKCLYKVVKPINKMFHVYIPNIGYKFCTYGYYKFCSGKLSYMVYIANTRVYIYFAQLYITYVYDLDFDLICIKKG